MQSQAGGERFNWRFNTIGQLLIQRTFLNPGATGSSLRIKAAGYKHRVAAQALAPKSQLRDRGFRGIVKGEAPEYGEQRTRFAFPSARYYDVKRGSLLTYARRAPRAVARGAVHSVPVHAPRVLDSAGSKADLIAVQLPVH